MKNSIVSVRDLKDKKLHSAKLVRFALTSKVLTTRQRVRILSVGGAA